MKAAVSGAVCSQLLGELAGRVGSPSYWLDSSEQKDLCASVKLVVFAFTLHRVQCISFHLSHPEIGSRSKTLSGTHLSEIFGSNPPPPPPGTPT